MRGFRLVPKPAGRLLLIGSLALVGFTATTAHAAFPGVNGQIAMTRCEDGPDCTSWHIWVTNPDGSGQAQLFQDPGYYGDDPSYSADGRWIAFQRCVKTSSGFQCGIAVVDAHGHNLRQLTPADGTHYDDYPAFSPDGSVIVFGRDGDIWAMGADGSNPHALTSSTHDNTPHFAPDGSQIVFRRSGQLWLMSPTGANQHAIPGSTGFDSRPDFSPDGKQVVFTNCPSPSCSIEVTNLDGSDRHSVTTPFGGGSDEDGSFSPDGTTIVFDRTTSSSTSAQFPLFVVDPSGTGTPHQLDTASDYAPSWGRVPTPSVDSPPTVSGTPRAGHVLTATPGAANWGGTTSFQWLLCNAQGASCAPIPGATATTYKPTNSAAGHTLKVRQTQADVGGSASGDSAATSKISSEPGVRIAHRGTVSAKGVARITLRCPTTQSGFCKGKLTLTGSRSRAAKKVGVGSFKIRAGGHATVKVRLSGRARAALARAGKLKLSATARTRDDAGNLTTTRTKITLKPA